MGTPPLSRFTNPFDAWAINGDFTAPGQPDLCTEFLTGSAGTGKTYEVKRRSAADPEGVIVAATTGIAAVNLGPEVTTVHSLLKFFNYNSLVDGYTSGALQRNIRGLADNGMRELVIDEISMLSAPALDVLYNACNEVARGQGHPVITLTLVGDFCQLPPIPDRDSPGTEKYAFEADCWRPNFSEHTTRLTRIWRQDHGDFVLALQAARRGAGDETLAYLQRAGVRFEPWNHEFAGTTLCATNREVDAYNMRRLRQIPGDNASALASDSTRWSLDHRDLSQWRSIPDQFFFKLGAYVMILSNNSPAWVNGDCGTVVGTQDRGIVVRLKRNNREVLVGKITREVTTRRRPTGVAGDMIVLRSKNEYYDMVRANGEPPRQVVMLTEPRPEWITGWVTYDPLRLAYATTVHKSQGLSLDALQLDLSSGFLASPAMMYVALSRCKTPEGLVLVGTPEQVVARTNIDPRVTEWL